MATKTKILIISGDSAMLRFFEQNLNGNDWDVVSTQHAGEEIGAVLNNELPDLVILDIMMPSMEGIEVCLRLRQLSEVPIMMLSAWGAGIGMVRGLDLGAESYLTEPFGIDEVRARINEVLRYNFAAVNRLPDIPSVAS